MKKNVILLLFFLVNAVYAQHSTNVQDIFKMMIFLNKENAPIGKDSSIKNDSLYRIFSQRIILKIDTLKVTNNLKDLYNYKDLGFYSVNESDIRYQGNLLGNDINFIGTNCGLTKLFIIAVDNKRGYSYRLAGFDTNDFFAFLYYFKEIYQNNNFKKLTTNAFLKNYQVESLDFYCLNKALRMKKIDRIKYPCLGRCNDPIQIGILKTHK